MARLKLAALVLALLGSRLAQAPEDAIPRLTILDGLEGNRAIGSWTNGNGNPFPQYVFLFCGMNYRIRGECTDPDHVVRYGWATGNPIEAPYTPPWTPGQFVSESIECEGDSYEGHHATVWATFLPVDFVDLDLDCLAEADEESPGAFLPYQAGQQPTYRHRLALYNGGCWSMPITLTRSSTAVRVFDAPAGGNEITFNGTDNVWYPGVNYGLFGSPPLYGFLYVEAAEVGECTLTLQIRNMPLPDSDAIKITVFDADLDVDSDNTNGFAEPPDSEATDAIEDIADDPQHPGKFIQVNDGDFDADGIPDYFDGFNANGTGGDDDDLIGQANPSPDAPRKQFVPVVLRLSPGVPADATVRFSYDASDPAGVTLAFLASGAYALPGGSLRLWTKDASTQRWPYSTAEDGDFVPSGVDIPASRLPLGDGNKITLYAEALAPSTSVADARIQVAVTPPGCYEPATDAVRCTLIQMQFVIPGEYDEATGLPKPNAAPVPTSFVGVSDPRPTVTLDEVSSSAVTIANGVATVTLNGIVKDPIADNVPEGAGADIEHVTVSVDGVALRDGNGMTLEVPVTRHEDTGAGFWRQHPYKGTFEPITVAIPAEEGTHIVRVETSKNAAGNTGFDEVAVTLEKRAIPFVEDPAPPEGPYVRGLWHLDEATPPPAGVPTQPFTPDADTALLFQFEQYDQVPTTWWEWVGTYQTHWELQWRYAERWEWVWGPHEYWDWVWDWGQFWDWAWDWGQFYDLVFEYGLVWEWVWRTDENGNWYQSWEEVWDCGYFYEQVWRMGYVYEQVWRMGEVYEPVLRWEWAYEQVWDYGWDYVEVSGYEWSYQPLWTSWAAVSTSGNPYPGMLFGSPSPYATGRFGACVGLNGNGDFVEMQMPFGQSINSPTGDFTLEAWVRPETVAGSRTILSLTGGCVLSIEDGKLVWRSGYGQEAHGSRGIPAGQWTHVAAVRDGDTLALFVNGEVDVRRTLPPLGFGFSGLRIGTTGNCVWDYFQGCVDEVRISTVARYGRNGARTPDSSGNGNHGILRGFAELAPGGHAGQALDGGYVEVPASASLTLGSADFTIEVWVKPTDVQGGPVLDKRGADGAEFGLSLSYGLVPSFYLYGDGTGTGYVGLYPSGSLACGEWSRLTIERVGETLRMLMNGEEVATATFTGGVADRGAGLWIGGCKDWGDTRFHGRIDEVSLASTWLLHASIYIPAALDPETANTIHYFHGVRDANAGDPAFTETGPNTLIFTGTFQGLDTTIVIDPATFGGLTENTDLFQATVTHILSDGAVMAVPMAMVESGPDTRVFRGDAGALNGSGYWTKKAQEGENTISFLQPFSARCAGLPPEAIASYTCRMFGQDLDWEMKSDGWAYLKGPGSRAFGFICPHRVRVGDAFEIRHLFSGFVVKRDGVPQLLTQEVDEKAPELRVDIGATGSNTPILKGPKLRSLGKPDAIVIDNVKHVGDEKEEQAHRLFQLMHADHQPYPYTQGEFELYGSSATIFMDAPTLASMIPLDSVIVLTSAMTGVDKAKKILQAGSTVIVASHGTLQITADHLKQAWQALALTPGERRARNIVFFGCYGAEVAQPMANAIPAVTIWATYSLNTFEAVALVHYTARPKWFELEPIRIGFQNIATGYSRGLNDPQGQLIDFARLQQLWPALEEEYKRLGMIVKAKLDVRLQAGKNNCYPVWWPFTSTRSQP